jgi:hypothetical protein
MIRAGLACGTVQCVFCKSGHVLRMGVHPAMQQATGEQHGVHFECDASGTRGSVSLSTLALFVSEGRRFWKDHPRMELWPVREMEVEGRAALLTSFQSVTNQARLDVISARDTLEVLAIHRLP